MTYTVETSLRNFPAWSGAKDRLKILVEKRACEEVEDFIEQMFYDKTPTETDINDYLWFDVENDFPQYFKDDDDEKDD